MVASPRKNNNPSTSVAVEINIPADVAGSFPKYFNTNGTIVPKKPPTTILNIIATPTISEIVRLSPKNRAIGTVIKAVIVPFRKAAIISRFIAG